jgi:hypothetical protein
LLPVAVPLLFAACDALPVITFTQADASDDTTEAPPPVDAGETRSADAGAGAPNDAAAAPATPADAAPPVDAALPPPSADAAPPQNDDAATPPPDAAMTAADAACGPPCRGVPSACAEECTNCRNDCRSSGACCLDHNGNYQGCADTVAMCPAP